MLTEFCGEFSDLHSIFRLRALRYYNARYCLLSLLLGDLPVAVAAVVFLSSILRYWQTRTHCCGHIVAMMFLGLRKLGNICCGHQMCLNQNRKHFLCPGQKICVRNKCCTRGQTGKHLCRQQCVLVCQYIPLGSLRSDYATTLIKNDLIFYLQRCTNLVILLSYFLC